MLKELKLNKVGPCEALEAHFAPRLNLITGDNGLGKSFLLDIAWWALTRRWPRDLNKALVSGYGARPTSAKEGSIEFSVEGKANKDVRYRSTFSPSDEAWTGKAGRPYNPGLVLYAMADGGFALWDPARNYWKQKGNTDVQERIPAYVFGPHEVWDGLYDPERGQLCNGLVNDWAGWQKENGPAFQMLCDVLRRLSPPGQAELKPGPFARISLDDVRDIPTLVTPYGKPVPVLHASSGVRRVVALAYLLVWAWQEHQKASALLEQAITPQVVFLIDEIEAHLHPRWQRSIVSALLDVTHALAQTHAQVQLIVATHSPLVLAAVEPQFNGDLDAWFDLDMVKNEEGTAEQVLFQRRHYVRLGDVSRWLVSEAFDLGAPTSLQAEQALHDAREAMGCLGRGQAVAADRLAKIEQALRASLADIDPFWALWRYALAPAETAK